MRLVRMQREAVFLHPSTHFLQRHNRFFATAAQNNLWRSEFLTHLCPPKADPPAAQHFVDFRCDLGDASRDSFGADGFQMVRAVGVNVRVGRDGPAVALRYVVL